jgi:hypothetical protein
VGVITVPLMLPCRLLMLGTAEIGIVTFANAVVPGWPVAVKLRDVDEPETLVMVASLLMESVQPVPQPPVVTDWTVTVSAREWESEPVVPVTVTVKIPAEDPDTVRVEVPEPATLVGLKMAVRLASEVVADNATVPENPLRPVTVIVEVPELPAAKAIVVGLAAIVKSETMTVTVAVWLMVPLVPVTTTL